MSLHGCSAATVLKARLGVPSFPFGFQKGAFTSQDRACSDTSANTTTAGSLVSKVPSMQSGCAQAQSWGCKVSVALHRCRGLPTLSGLQIWAPRTTLGVKAVVVSGKSAGLGPRRWGLQSSPCYCLAGRPWANQFPALCLSFPICKPVVTTCFEKHLGLESRPSSLCDVWMLGRFRTLKRCPMRQLGIQPPLLTHPAAHASSRRRRE